MIKQYTNTHETGNYTKFLDKCLYNAIKICGGYAKVIGTGFWQTKLGDGRTYWETLKQDKKLQVQNMYYSFDFEMEKELKGVLYRELPETTSESRKSLEKPVQIKDTEVYCTHEGWLYLYIGLKLVCTVSICKRTVQKTIDKEKKELSKEYRVFEESLRHLLVYDE